MDAERGNCVLELQKGNNDYCSPKFESDMQSKEASAWAQKKGKGKSAYPTAFVTAIGI